MSCAARQARYAAKGWRMAAIERYLDHGGALCAGLEYVTPNPNPNPNPNLDHGGSLCAGLEYVRRRCASRSAAWSRTS